jgi:CO/xanthine dehydrogenase Mo-binding subunit
VPPLSSVTVVGSVTVVVGVVAVVVVGGSVIVVVVVAVVTVEVGVVVVGVAVLVGVPVAWSPSSSAEITANATPRPTTAAIRIAITAFS